MQLSPTSKIDVELGQVNLNVLEKPCYSETTLNLGARKNRSDRLSRHLWAAQVQKSTAELHMSA
jgi:hypothetical protein